MQSFFRFHEINILTTTFLYLILCLTLTSVLLRSVPFLPPIATIHCCMTQPTPNSTSPADICSVVVMLIPTGASESYGWPHERTTKEIFSCTFTPDFRAQSFLLLLMSLQHWVTFFGGTMAMDRLHYIQQQDSKYLCSGGSLSLISVQDACLSTFYISLLFSAKFCWKVVVKFVIQPIILHFN